MFDQERDVTMRATALATYRRQLNRRALIRLIAGGGAALAIAPAVGRGGRVVAQDGTPVAGGSPVGSAGSLTVYSGRNEELVGDLIARFEGATGIDAEVRYASTGELAATLLEEGDNSPAGVFFGQDAGALGALAQEGRLAPLPDEILNRVVPEFRSPDGLWVGVSGRARVAVYNTDLLTEADLPASVLDLVDEEWRGKVGWAPENASFQSFVTALRTLEGEDGARAWLEGMIANEAVNFADSNGAVVRAVGAGEIPLGLVNHYYLYEIQAEEGELPIANHFFPAGDPGSLVNVAAVGLLADGPDAERALAFVDYLLLEEAQTYFAEETSEYPLIEGVDPAVELPALADLEIPEIDLTDLADLQGTQALLTEVGLL